MRIEKYCKKHGMVQWSISVKRPQGRCTKCRVEDVTKRRRKVKQMLIDGFGGKCTRCGYNKYQGALVFHHLDPLKKDFHLARKGVSISYQRMLNEANKCILLCHNCHAEVHAGL